MAQNMLAFSLVIQGWPGHLVLVFYAIFQKNTQDILSNHLHILHKELSFHHGS